MIRKKLLFGLTLIVAAIILIIPTLNAKILVIAPHPDDDLITSAGIIYRANDRGEPVRAVFLTNGDKSGIQRGYERQAEAVGGESYLDTPEDDLIFLGYPDGYLSKIFNNYTKQTDLYVSPNGISKTYGNRGLGRMDYHSYRFGVPANYNRYNMVLDLQDILADFLPDDIFITSEFDVHSDHSTTYQLLKLSLLSLHDVLPNYTPVIHKTIVWQDDTNWPNAMDPTLYFSQIPSLAPTGLIWTDRESLDVPLDMQSKDYEINPKYLAISAHVTQGGTAAFLGKFIHKDEIFWAENVLSNNSPPIVNAGVDQTVRQGQVVYLDGSNSRDPDDDVLNFQWVQLSGSPVQLSDPYTAQPSFTAPSGVYQNETLVFELVVSDGQFDSIPDAVSINISSNIASLAAVTASSQNTSTGQLAVKAVDGVVDGYPGDYTKEWATVKQKAGAWIRLTWPVPYMVDRIILHDRPNSNDQILSATLSFSDGSTLNIGLLSNAGGPAEYTFLPVEVTSIVMTVNQVSSSTSNVGLSEIEVYGEEAPSSMFSNRNRRQIRLSNRGGPS